MSDDDASRTDRTAGLAARLAQTAEIILKVGETHDDQLIPVLAVAVAAQLSADPVVAGLGSHLSDLLASIEEGPLSAADGLGLLEVLNELAPHDLGAGVVPIPTVAVDEQWQTRTVEQILDANARLNRTRSTPRLDDDTQAPLVFFGPTEIGGAVPDGGWLPDWMNTFGASRSDVWLGNALQIEFVEHEVSGDAMRWSPAQGNERLISPGRVRSTKTKSKEAL